MPRGGKRTGKPGGSYPNRTDLATAPDPGASTFKGQPYGAATQQAAVAGSGGGAPPVPPPEAPAGPAPGSFGDFGRPTERPNEPLTHGHSTGPGAGTEILPQQSDSTLNMLRAAYQRSPSAALEQIIEDIEGSARGGP